MPDRDRVRLEIAFEGVQVLTVQVPTDTADAIEKALSQGKESLTFDAEDGCYSIAVDKVVFVKRFARESRVGFGADG